MLKFGNNKKYLSINGTMTNQTIKTETDVRELLSYLIGILGWGFHPCDPIYSYYREDGSPLFDKDEADVLEKELADSYDLCEANGIDFYKMSMDICKEMHGDKIENRKDSLRKFQYDVFLPSTMTEVVLQVVNRYSLFLNLGVGAHEIRNTFVKAFKDVDIEDIIETEDEYKTRRSNYPSSHRSIKLILPNYEKIYVTNQWRSKENQNFYDFIEVVRKNGWGEIKEIDL